MESVGEIEPEGRDNHQDKDYIIAHAISVATCDIVVDTRREASM
jgi:hypothetical protein